jgi:hypothetical protein
MILALVVAERNIKNVTGSMTDSNRSKSSKKPSSQLTSRKGPATLPNSGSAPDDDPLAGLPDLPPLEVGLKQTSGEVSNSGETSRQDFMTQPPIEQVDDFEDLSAYQKKWELQQEQVSVSTPTPEATPVLDLSVPPPTEEVPPPLDLKVDNAVSIEIALSNDGTSSDLGAEDSSPAPDFGSATSINASQFENELPEFKSLDLPAFPEEASPTESWQSTSQEVGPVSDALTEKESLISAETPSGSFEVSRDSLDSNASLESSGSLESNGSLDSKDSLEFSSSADRLASTSMDRSASALAPNANSIDTGATLRSHLAGDTEKASSPASPSPTVFRATPLPEEVPAGHPDLYTLVIEGNLSPEEREKLTDLVLRNDLGIKEADLAIQFRSQQIFLPKLTEFTAVVIAQAMRAVGGRLRVFHASRLEDPSRQSEGVLTGQANQDMNTKVTLAAPMDHPAEQIPITQDQWIPDLPPEQVESIRVLSATAILNPEEVADAASAVYQARLESLCRELRFRAHFLGIHALVSFHSQLTPLSLSPHYRLTVSVNGLTRKSPKSEPTDETTKGDERNLSIY